jgi:flavin reductase (DIM6/NTAB) family NADH-FMN oxidoreductase RutF
MSHSRANQRLSLELFHYLQAQHPIIVITIGADGEPWADIVSWVMAADDHTIRVVIGSQRPSVANIRANGRTALQILGGGLAYEIRGTARVIKERCESIRFPQTMVELSVESVRENMYPANFVTGDVPVTWPESTNGHHEQWNSAIVEEMKTICSSVLPKNNEP